MIKAYKYRIYPTKGQKQTVLSQLLKSVAGCTTKLAYRKDAWDRTKRVIARNQEIDSTL